MNPFYSERHDLSGPDLDHSGLDDSRPLVVSPPSQPASTHDPLYPHQQVRTQIKPSINLVLFSSTSTLFYTRLPRPIRHQTPRLPSLSCPSNPTPIPSLAADRRWSPLLAQGHSFEERTVTCPMGRPVRRLQALLIFTSDLIHACSSGLDLDGL